MSPKAFGLLQGLLRLSILAKKCGIPGSNTPARVLVGFDSCARTYHPIIALLPRNTAPEKLLGSAIIPVLYDDNPSATCLMLKIIMIRLQLVGSAGCDWGFTERLLSWHPKGRRQLCLRSLLVNRIHEPTI